MTVEAAVVVPMVIFILAAVIYLCFFLHDRAVLQSYSLRQAESTAWEKEIRAGRRFSWLDSMRKRQMESG